MQYSPDLIFILDQEGILVEINRACSSLLGYDVQELIGTSIKDLVYAADLDETLMLLDAIVGGSKSNYHENRLVHKTGSVIDVSWTIGWSEEDGYLFCVGRSGAANLKAEYSKVKEDFNIGRAQHHELTEHASGVLDMLDTDGGYIYAGGAINKRLGYSSEELIGQNVFDYIHRDDVKKFKEAWIKLNNLPLLQVPGYRFLAANGEWRWLETILSNQRYNPEVNAIILISQDITEQKKSWVKTEDSDQRFRSLFENNPDMVVYENKKGVILDVNRAAETIFGFERHELINRTPSAIFPAATLPLFYERLQEAAAGKQVNFEAEIEFRKTGKHVLDIKKIPVVVDEQLVGIFTVAKDITAVRQSFNIIKKQANKLNTIFESLTDAFFTLDRDWNLTYINSEFDRLLQTNKKENIGRKLWEVFPEEKNGVFYRHYKHAMETGAAAHFEAYLSRLNAWFEVKAFASEEGLSVYFSDITNRIIAQEELKKLSVVASKTHNGVIIADKSGVIEWVNDSFTHITEYTADEQYGKSIIDLFTGAGTLQENARHAVSKIISSSFFEAEVPFTAKSGRELWLEIGVTLIKDTEGSVTRYIVMISDITLQKQAILERNQFIEVLQSSNQSLHEFTHVVSHKLRSPVANILGLTSLFNLPDIDNATKEEVIDKLGTAAHNLDSVIRDLNHVLSLRDSFDLEKTNVQFDDVLNRVILLLQDQLTQSQVEIRRDFSLAPSVYAIEHYLLDIMYNLLNNAIKFQGSEEKPLVEVYTQAEEDFIVLVVKDNGIGFDLDKHRNDVFGMYKRFHSHVGGKGLGLYLVKTQVETMGGRISVNSKNGAGSKFEIYFRKIDK
ncbi:PAS domain S-box protein [Cesiribacter sp. SM1]|uniref:PAS domain S-box protein n=1 Tax=Cesiribacter sp. SM1 TaxID=2861196 RepID=UPI001CD199C8|nr:PAS domain S-box protein [Cesiribacter sp. SM1]